MSTKFDPSHPPDSCPFCTIATTFPIYDPLYPPSSSSPPTPLTTTNSPSSPTNQNPLEEFPPTTSATHEINLHPEQTTPSTYLLLSTPHTLAFLDILPLSPGHLLLTTRSHKEKISDVTDEEAAELGRWIPVLSRVVAATLGCWDWNVVQNNGAAAAQVVGHVHFHIIPRPALTDELRNKSFTMFGRGQRSDLDDGEAAELVGRLRGELAREMERIGRGKL